MGNSKYRNLLLFLLIALLAGSCSSSRKLGSEKSVSSVESGITSCDSLYEYKTLYIRKISANIGLGEESYSAKLTLYYKPDSELLISAVNAGFEIIRIGVKMDSTVIINRLDKMVYVLKNSGSGYAPPVNLGDIELLLNRPVICEMMPDLSINDGVAEMDMSERDIAKRVKYSTRLAIPVEFEFFHKKTGEYIVGEMTGEQIFMIYSNYILKDLELEVEGGELEYDRELEVDLTVNRNKYDIIYL